MKKLKKPLLILLGIIVSSFIVLAGLFWWEARIESECVVYVRDTLKTKYNYEGDNTLWWEEIERCEDEKNPNRIFTVVITRKLL